MRGIVGYIGSRNASEILVDGLRRLEYRGYDSSGIAVLNGYVHVVKSQGPLQRLEECLAANPVAGNVGIAHTRWATFGASSDASAHPHVDCSGRLAVVLNGRIENDGELRSELRARGHSFTSESDTEVVAHLIEECYRGDLRTAVIEALQRLRGSYALVAASVHHPGELVAARKESPLVIGLGDGEAFLASDIPAVLHQTQRFYVLEDGEVAVVTADGVEVLSRDGQPVGETPPVVSLGADTAEKNGFEHFMLKEIYEQPESLINATRGRLATDADGGNRVTLDGVNLSPEEARALEQVVIVGCGTAYHAGLLGAAYMRQLAGLRASAEIASEFRYGDADVGPGTLAVFVSQSGETAETLSAMREAKRRGCTTLAVVNVIDSSMAREADHVLFTLAGPEIAIASTKAYVAQVVCLLQLALFLGRHRGSLPADAPRIFADLRTLPQLARQVIDACAARMRTVAAAWTDVKSAYYIGRGLDYAVAREGQLKLKETSYIHAEALAAGELRHGPIALVADGMPVVAIATQPHVYDKMLSIAEEARARGATVIGVSMMDDARLDEICTHWFHIPETHPLLAPMLAILPLQILSYEVARARGCDVDKPRYLTKSVRVE